jgi:hypothetical protein
MLSVRISYGSRKHGGNLYKPLLVFRLMDITVVLNTGYGGLFILFGLKLHSLLC